MIDRDLTKKSFAWPRLLVAVVFLTINGAIVIVFQANFLAYLVNQVFLENQGIGDLWKPLIVLLFIFLSRGLLNFQINKLGIILSGKIKKNLREDLFKKIENLGAIFLIEEKTGQLVSVLTEGIDQLDSYFTKYLPSIIQGMIIPIVILIVIIPKSTSSGLILLITAPLIPLFMYLIGNMAEEKSQKQLQSLLKFSGFFLEIIQGLTTLKIFGRSKNQSKNINLMSNNFKNRTLEVLRIAFLSALALEILATISTAMIAVEVGLKLVYGKLGFQVAFFILLLTPELYLPLRNLGGSFHAGKASIGAWKEISNIFGEDYQNSLLGEGKGKEKIPQPFPPRIQVNSLSFTYIGKDDKKTKEILRNINLAIAPGEKLALVGQSGSGKTTFLKILMGLLTPNHGEILINDMPLHLIAKKDWFREVAYISQEPYLFSGTIADNIALGKDDASLEEIVQAAKEAAIDDFIRQLPLGYDTKVGEGERGISGGEKQRIAIARVFLKKPSIIFLDEPTEGLDLKNQLLIRDSLDKLSHGRTMVMIAHKIETVINEDRIILLKNGRIEGIGSHKELEETSEHYRSLLLH